MDKIFLGLIKSESCSDVDKQRVFGMLAKSGSNGMHATAEILAVLRVTVDCWVAKNNNPVNMEGAKMVYLSWANINLQLFNSFVCEQLNPSSLFLDKELSVATTSDWISTSLELMRSQHKNKDSLPSPLVSLETLMKLFITSDLARRSENILDLAALASLLTKNPSCIPQEALGPFITVLMHALSKTSCASPESIKHAAEVGRFVRFLWTLTEPHISLIKHTLHILFTMVSALEDQPISIALSVILQSIPEVMIKDTCRTLVKDAHVKDTQLSRVLCKMLDWLAWPKHVTIHKWIIELIQVLKEESKLVVLFEVIDQHAATVTSKLCYRPIQRSTLPVIEMMLLSHQTCPGAFHSSVNGLVNAISCADDEAIAMRISALIQTEMFMYPGYPEVYGPLMDVLGKFPTLSETTMSETVNAYRIPVVKRTVFSSSKERLRSRVDWAGLENLGNTCFMNAILQALFMVQDFRSRILRLEIDSGTNVHCGSFCSSNGPSSTQLVLKQLQILFALLCETERCALRPTELVKVGLPSQFTPGDQQDSSEYLDFLLDHIRELDKSLNSSHRGSQPTAISQLFQGKHTTRTLCTECGGESALEEHFYNILLRFPNNTAHSEELGDLVERFLLPEKLSGDDRYACESCGCLQDATRCVTDLVPARCLVFTLCRFSASRGVSTKIKTSVLYPTTLDLDGRTFHLNAVVVHSGSSLHSGHYYTYARSLHNRPEQWYLFNDQNVSTCASPVTRSAPSRLSSDTPYILFYTEQIAQGLEEIQLSSVLQQLVVKDKLAAQQEILEEQRRQAARKDACQPHPSIINLWADDDDDDGPHPGSDNSIDLSGSRFVF